MREACTPIRTSTAVCTVIALALITGIFAIAVKTSASSQILFGQRAQQLITTLLRNPPRRVRRQDVAGWPTFKSEKYGYFLRYPPDWKLTVEESDGSISVINMPFEPDSRDISEPRRATEIYVSAIQKKPHVPMEAVDELFALFKDQAVALRLDSGVEAYRIEFDDGDVPGMPSRFDEGYFLPTENTVYYFQLTSTDVSDVVMQKELFSQVVNSFGLILRSH